MRLECLRVEFLVPFKALAPVWLTQAAIDSIANRLAPDTTKAVIEGQYSPQHALNAPPADEEAVGSIATEFVEAFSVKSNRRYCLTG